jgi:predicted phosphoribosyltransferase
MLFANRAEAGRTVARALSSYADRPDVLVLALPRGGVPVAYQIARALHAPLDIFLVRKLGVPGHEEMAMGAIAADGTRVINDDAVRTLDIPDDIIDVVAEEERQEIERRARAYRGDRPASDVHGKVIILVDDGLATGSSMRAAVAALRKRNPARIIVAVPVGSAQTCEEFALEADEVVCARTPDPFYAVGLWYGDFSQLSDEEVRDMLKQAAREYAAGERAREPQRVGREEHF